MKRLKTLPITTILVALLSASSLLLIIPSSHAAPGGRPFTGPPLLGIFDSASDFLKETPGIGEIAKVTCTDGTDLGAGNIRINCDSTNLPHDEMSVAIDPANPNHIVAGSNDYELFFVGSTLVERIIAGYYTSFDGGKTWLSGHVDPGGLTFSGDPSVSFNRKLGLVHYGVQASSSGANGIQVNTSEDGGKTFAGPVVVSKAGGGSTSIVFHDKPYITVDNSPLSPFYGRLYVTWTRFQFDRLGNYLGSPIFLSFSDDGGKTFTFPREISGNSQTLCGHPGVPSNTGRCNEDQFSSPVAGPGGALYVAFENDEFQGAPEFRSQYLVVRSLDGGQIFQGPFQAVATIFDGNDDYPININGRQTLSNSQFRVNSAGNLAADPASGPSSSTTRLFVSFSDNRNGELTGDFSTVSTNTDVFIVTSDDGGASWNSPVSVLRGEASQNDQWFPWATVGQDGVLRVAFKDKSYDPDNIQYGETLATSPDGRTFTAVRVDTGLSNPNDSRWFTNGGQTNGKATFIGDYEGLAVGSDGVSHPLWTDMRTRAFNTVPPGRGHNTQDAVTAAVF